MLGGDPMFSMQQFTGEAIEPQKRKKKLQKLKRLFLIDGIVLNVDAPDTTAHLL